MGAWGLSLRARTGRNSVRLFAKQLISSTEIKEKRMQTIPFGLFLWCSFVEERQGHHLGITCCFSVVSDARTRTLEAPFQK